MPFEESRIIPPSLAFSLYLHPSVCPHFVPAVIILIREYPSCVLDVMIIIPNHPSCVVFYMSFPLKIRQSLSTQLAWGWRFGRRLQLPALYLPFLTRLLSFLEKISWSWDILRRWIRLVGPSFPHLSDFSQNSGAFPPPL